MNIKHWIDSFQSITATSSDAEVTNFGYMSILLDIQDIVNTRLVQMCMEVPSPTIITYWSGTCSRHCGHDVLLQVTPIPGYMHNVMS
jgi:hypothetical protein